jgi:hypothetical protein
MLITRTNKQGIDKAIGKLQTWLHKLNTYLGFETDDPLYKCYPRIYRNLTESGYIPETKLTDNASGYSEVLWDDKLKALSFFGAVSSLTWMHRLHRKFILSSL